MQAKTLIEDNRKMKQMIEERNRKLSQQSSQLFVPTLSSLHFKGLSNEVEIKVEDGIPSIYASESSLQQLGSVLFPAQTTIANANSDEMDVYLIEEGTESEDENDNLTTTSTTSSSFRQAPKPHKKSADKGNFCFECSNLLIFNENTGSNSSSTDTCEDRK